ncbi:peptidase A4 family-domain-containing protein [Phyllosticta citrichinensis]
MHFTTTFVILLSATTVLALPGNFQPQLSAVKKSSSKSSGDEYPLAYGIAIEKPPSGKFTAISATFKVPTLKLGDKVDSRGYGIFESITAYVGLDGAAVQGSEDVLLVGLNIFINQAGATMTVPDGNNLVLRGKAEWYDTPCTEWTEKDLKIVYGDVIKLSVDSPSGTAATLSIENTNTRVKITKPLTAPHGTPLLGDTAEWLVQNLVGADGKLLPPPDFGTITFTDCVATTSDGKTYGPDAGQIFDQGDQLKTDTTGNTVNVKFVSSSAGTSGAQKPPPAAAGDMTSGTAQTG